MWSRGFIFGWMVAFSVAANAQTRVYGYDLSGHPVRHLMPAESKAVVVFVLASDCPISNRYAPEIVRLAREFEARDVAVWLVYPNATETTHGVVKHEEAFALTLPTLVRPSPSLMAETLVSITPEAAVLAPERRGGLTTVYSGRIDDRYVDIGRERPKATRHDLEEAVDALLDHRTVAAAGGPPVGCGIVSEAALGKP